MILDFQDREFLETAWQRLSELVRELEDMILDSEDHGFLISARELLGALVDDCTMMLQDVTHELRRQILNENRKFLVSARQRLGKLTDDCEMTLQYTDARGMMEDRRYEVLLTDGNPAR